MHDHHKFADRIYLWTIGYKRSVNDGLLIGFSRLLPPSLTTAAAMPPRQLPLSVVRLVVSTDGEQYRVVDISGAPDGTWIRRHILLKLSIPERLHGQFSIYPSEVGAYALGGAMSDGRLFTHCRDSGDPSGSLKFFVSTAPDQPLPSDTSFTSQGFPSTADRNTKW